MGTVIWIRRGKSIRRRCHSRILDRSVFNRTIYFWPAPRAQRDCTVDLIVIDRRDRRPGELSTRPWEKWSRTGYCDRTKCRSASRHGGQCQSSFDFTGRERNPNRQPAQRLDLRGTAEYIDAMVD